MVIKLNISQKFLKILIMVSKHKVSEVGLIGNSVKEHIKLKCNMFSTEMTKCLI